MSKPTKEEIAKWREAYLAGYTAAMDEAERLVRKAAQSIKRDTADHAKRALEAIIAAKESAK